MQTLPQIPLLKIGRTLARELRTASDAIFLHWPQHLAATLTLVRMHLPLISNEKKVCRTRFSYIGWCWQRQPCSNGLSHSWPTVTEGGCSRRTKLLTVIQVHETLPSIYSMYVQSAAFGCVTWPARRLDDAAGVSRACQGQGEEASCPGVLSCGPLPGLAMTGRVEYGAVQPCRGGVILAGELCRSTLGMPRAEHQGRNHFVEIHDY